MTKILILGKDAELIANVIGDDKVSCVTDRVAHFNTEYWNFVICFNYRYIIPKTIIEKMPDRIINIHGSFLPWNRGCYPNFFSFLYDTPKGVTIHYIDDEGIDKGDIIAQKLVYFSEPNLTLKTTYNLLIFQGVELFRNYWPFIKNNYVYRFSQLYKPTYNSKKDFKEWKHLLTNGWDTPVSILTDYACDLQMATQFRDDYIKDISNRNKAGQ